MNIENEQQNIQQQGSYPSESLFQKDEIGLSELFSIIWKGKWLVIGVTSIFAIASIVIALWLPNEYKATAVVQPSDNNKQGGVAALAGQFGGLASLAGINLGGSESTDAIVAMEIIKSWGFAEQFVDKHKLAVPLYAAQGWDKATNKLKIDERIYNTDEKKWLMQSSSNSKGPTSWDLYEKYQDRLSIIEDKQTGLISISIIHYSPYIAKQWTDWLIQDINAYMKQRALKEANDSIEYLEEQINQTSVAEIRVIFSQLIQEQHKSKMLAQVLDEYVFKTISPAKVPEKKEKPKRAIIAISGTLLGGLLSIMIVLILGMVSRYRRN